MIQVQHISKSFGSLKVLTDVCLSVNRGELVSILGPSGCGKTTLLRIIAGLIPSDSGRVVVDGDNSEIVRRAGRLGYVFQQPVLLPWRTALENVALPLEIKSLSPKERKISAVAMLQRMGLEQFCESTPSQLSGGMKQRVAIARALVSRPDILLMDEPFSALDEFMRESYDLDLRVLAKSLQQTVILVTHSLWESVIVSDRIVVLGNRPSTVRDIVNVNIPEGCRAEIESDFHRDLIHELRELLRVH